MRPGFTPPQNNLAQTKLCTKLLRKPLVAITIQLRISFWMSLVFTTRMSYLTSTSNPSQCSFSELWSGNVILGVTDKKEKSLDRVR